MILYTIKLSQTEVYDLKKFLFIGINFSKSKFDVTVLKSISHTLSEI